MVGGPSWWGGGFSFQFFSQEGKLCVSKKYTLVSREREREFVGLLFFFFLPQFYIYINYILLLSSSRPHYTLGLLWGLLSAVALLFVAGVGVVVWWCGVCVCVLCGC